MRTSSLSSPGRIPPISRPNRRNVAFWTEIERFTVANRPDAVLASPHEDVASEAEIRGDRRTALAARRWTAAGGPCDGGHPCRDGDHRCCPELPRARQCGRTVSTGWRQCDPVPSHRPTGLLPGNEFLPLRLCPGNSRGLPGTGCNASSQRPICAIRPPFAATRAADDSGLSPSHLRASSTLRVPERRP